MYAEGDLELLKEATKSTNCELKPYLLFTNLPYLSCIYQLTTFTCVIEQCHGSGKIHQKDKLSSCVLIEKTMNCMPVCVSCWVLSIDYP